MMKSLLRNKAAKRLIFAMLMVIASFYMAKVITIRRVAYAQVRAIPFLLGIDNYNFETNLAGNLFHKKVIARRSDGSTATVSTVGPLEFGQTVKKVTFLSGESVSVFDTLLAKTSWWLNTAELAAQKERFENPPPDCICGDQRRRLREDVVQGHRAIVLESNDDERVTTWLAPDLGCELLQSRTEVRQPDGSYRLKSEGKCVYLKLGEPEPRFFDSASGYTELRPSEAQKRVLEKMGVREEDPQTRATGEHLDRKYLEQQR